LGPIKISIIYYPFSELYFYVWLSVEMSPSRWRKFGKGVGEIASPPPHLKKRGKKKRKEQGKKKVYPTVRESYPTFLGH
jgi:hypothetical protein